MKKLPFFDKDHGLTPLKNPNFSSFLTSRFYSLERRSFYQEYPKTHFPGSFCLKQKDENIGNF